MCTFKIETLGQVGVRLEVSGNVIYIDPYLSNSVQEKENSTIKRLIPIPLYPDEITDADFVLITHEHRDHCDEDTLVPISNASPQCQFIGPYRVVQKLEAVGFKKNRLVIANNKLELTDNLTVHIVPSAHPIVEKNNEGQFNSIGYIIECQGFKLYHAGDTSLCDELIEAIECHTNLDIALIPVNEKNYMRDKQGIIGNMSVREAFYFAEKISVKTLIPTHWDMFFQNQVYKEEIQLIYNKMKPDFQLNFGKILSNKLC